MVPQAGTTIRFPMLTTPVAASTRNCASELEKPRTLLEERIGLEYTGLSNIPELINSAKAKFVFVCLYFAFCWTTCLQDNSAKAEVFVCSSFASNWLIHYAIGVRSMGSDFLKAQRMSVRLVASWRKYFCVIIRDNVWSVCRIHDLLAWAFKIHLPYLVTVPYAFDNLWNYFIEVAC